MNLRFAALFAVLSLSASALLFPNDARAQATAAAVDWPTQPVRVIVPFSPGGPSDLTARVLADELGRHLSQPVVVENRTGAGSVLGTSVVARAPKDGHTILYTTSSLGYMKSLVLKLGFDPETDLTPVAIVGTTSYILISNNDFPAKTLADVVKVVRENPNRYNYGSAGIGSAMHFMFEHFVSTAGGLQVMHVPYRGGGGTLMNDLIAGQLQLATDPSSSTMPYLAKNNVRAIAVTSGKRLPNLPDVPTFKESGLPEFKDFEAYGWYMALVPSGTPPAIIERLNAAIRKAQASPALQQRWAASNMEIPTRNSPAEVQAFLRNEFRTWADVARKSGIKAE